jgi:rRNA biogenesis protein RRP5
MAAQKRALDDSSSTTKAKKSRTDSHKTDQPQAQQITSSLLTTDVDFPRGGGTSFTPLEVKAIRAEAVKEANVELFEVGHFIPSALTSPNQKLPSGCCLQGEEREKEKAQD